MLFILRQLRRLELRKRSGQYFVYAFGEIVLIVVGILIALQINEWKADRELERQRAVLMERLTADFRTTLERADECIQFNESKLESNSENLELLAGDLKDVNVEQLKSIDTRLVVDFQPVMGAYRSAVSTGMIGLIHDSTLNQLLIELEDEWNLYQNLRQLHHQEVFAATGARSRVAEMVGDENALNNRPNSTVSQRFALSDEAYLDIISRKDYYALRLVTHRINISMFRRVKDIKEKAEEILERLEEM